MQKLEPISQPMFIGAARGIERTVLPTTGFPFELLDLHPLYRSRPWENWKTLRGGAASWSRPRMITSQTPPRRSFGTGSSASGIVVTIAAIDGIQYVLKEQYC